MDKNFVGVQSFIKLAVSQKRRKKKKKEKEKKDEHNSLVVDRSCTTHCSRVDMYLMPYTICLKFKLYMSIHEGFDWLNMSVSPSKVLEISMGTQC